VSDWNAYLDRKAELDLSLAADRLADAIARHTLGWNARSNEVGRKLLRDYAGLHGRSFDRALAELVNAGLVKFTPGSLGRGHRARYELLLDGETAAPERPFSPEKAAEKAAQKAALERPRREKGERKEPPPGAAGLLAVLDEQNQRSLRRALKDYGDLPESAFAEARDSILAAEPENPAAYALAVLRRNSEERRRARGDYLPQLPDEEEW
jgi:hypothetical protein